MNCNGVMKQGGSSLNFFCQSAQKLPDLRSMQVFFPVSPTERHTSSPSHEELTVGLQVLFPASLLSPRLSPNRKKMNGIAVASYLHVGKGRKPED